MPPIYTVFPKDPYELPQDFSDFAAAKAYGDQQLGPGNYEIESPCD